MRNNGAFALCALLAMSGQAAAVELDGQTGQVNPAADLSNTVFDANVLPEKGGGFAVIWSKRSATGSIDQLYVRFYDVKAKAYGAEQRYDGPVDGNPVRNVSTVSGASLGGGKLLSVWSASFADGSPSQGVGRFFSGQQPTGGVAHVEDEPQASIRPIVALNDGKALITWSKPGVASELFGRFVKSNGKFGPANLRFTVGPRGSAPTIHPLHKGFVAIAYRQTKKDKLEVAAQIYNAKGKPAGDSFVVMSSKEKPNMSGVYLGLASGDLVLIQCQPPQGVFVCDVTGQLFRKGKKVGKPVKLVKGIPGQNPQAVALDRSGFLLALEDGDTSARRITYHRFDDRLRKDGAPARMIPRFQQNRGVMRELADGRVAAVTVVSNAAVNVQLVKP